VTDPSPVARAPRSEGSRMRRSYATVLVLWVFVLVSLYLFQSYFS
jgi:hypothetical protein